MASESAYVYPNGDDDLTSSSQTRIRNIKPILKSFKHPATNIRYDRNGTAILGRQHKVSFIDRVIKGAKIHQVIEVEAVDYPETDLKKGCSCALL